uniref:Uncharacterized protein n=1 Tax=Tanacetum cinerariifolium TaxID=118510 RepID=A0A6L2JKV3_TANCI|nr:hypothetical protein [Tanacetum cinerariifolium]
MLLAQVQEYGVILHEEQQDFLVDTLEEMDSDCEDHQLHMTSNFKADHVDAFDLDCDDEATASAIFMESLSLAGSINGDTIGLTYDSKLPFKVPHYDTYHENDVLNSVVQETKYNETSNNKPVYVEVYRFANPDEAKAVIAHGVKNHHGLICNLRGIRGAGKSDKESFYTSASVIFKILQDEDVRKKVKNKYEAKRLRKEKDMSLCGKKQ